MSYFVSKIGHLDPRFYSLIYCTIPEVQMSGVQMSGVQMSGVQMSGVQMYPTPSNAPTIQTNSLCFGTKYHCFWQVGSLPKHSWGKTRGIVGA